MDVRSLFAAQTYAASRPATEPQPDTALPQDGQIGSAFGKVIRDFTQTMQNGEQTAKATMMGNADPHALVQALAQSELAVEAVVTVRNKVVEAYQEILRMPV
jgi:flagellar hook-basal body complex protein FliE